MKEVLKKWILMAVNYTKFFIAYIKYNLASAMEYRASFISQSLFMILNDVLFLFIWFLFFEKFNEVNGFNFKDMINLWIFGAGTYGIVNTFFGNSAFLNKIISQGELDFYLAFPKNHLFHILISKMEVAAIGDILFSVIAFLFVHPISIYTISMLVIGLILGSLIMISFYILIGSMAFYLGRSETLHHSLMNSLLHFSTNPSSVFQGFIKFFIFFVIPAGFITFIPADLLKEFSLEKLIYLILFTIISFIISLKIYSNGLKKYTSGNLINIRV